MKTKYFIFAALLFSACITQQTTTLSGEQIEIGYGTADKGKLTTAVSQVNVNEKDVSGYSNIFDYIRGKVPGVAVYGNGPSAKIQIRGLNSINSPTDPLFVVDGVEVSDISMINPYDVKSISVLKDASSSIYGARGANGVILIKLKK